MLSMKKFFMIAAACVAMMSCAQKNTVTLFPASNFEGVVDGKNVSLYTLKAGDLTLSSDESAEGNKSTRFISRILHNE